MTITKNIVIPGSKGKPIALDIFHNGNGQMPVVIYAHGFNGFKDWANFDLVAYRFAQAGFTFVKFNFSHNGTTPSNPEDFVDLEAFGHNNYSKELEDLRILIDWVSDPFSIYHSMIDVNNISLIGHSMGGGIAILLSARDNRIEKLITWASIKECKTPWGNWPQDKLDDWKRTGVAYITNSRTKQEMPLYYQLYEDYVNNGEYLDIENAIRQLPIPILICHGTEDVAVPIAAAHALHEWQPNAKLFTVASDHVFGRSHPWNSDRLPQPMEEVLKASVAFLEKNPENRSGLLRENLHT